MQTRSKYILATIVLAVVWVGAIAYGLTVVLHYDNKPGAVGQVPGDWPQSSLLRPSDRDTLVMIAHPQCPCTRASIGELARVMARVQGQMKAYVLFVTPGQTGESWEDTNLRRSAAAIPGVTVVTDTDGAEAQRFGAETSGHTLLFDMSGRLVFSGGITQSRGHAGDNAGESALVSFVNRKPNATNQTSVFGCPLHDDKSSEKTFCRR